MKLYELDRLSKFKIVGERITQPFTKQLSSDEVYEFKHIDGMYSLCKDSKGNVVHPAAWTEVEVVA